ncbi:MAG: FdhF/YdeP family oxidoreductase, partial [Nocardioidaceae bacterium]
MTKSAPRTDFSDEQMKVKHAKTSAAGIPAIAVSLKMANDQMGVRRAVRTLARLNQKQGFDCPGCAWPDPDHRSRFEFCENGAKAVAEEATVRRVRPEFFATHPVSQLATMSDYYLGQQGRLTEPVYKADGSDHYAPVSWERAFDVVAEKLKSLSSPDEATFYTSGRTSNEAAFVYQLMVRRFGTNNLPDCSNMCHESSGAALAHAIGIGKGSVLLDDIYDADLIVIVGQNPGTNHPRMLTALEKAKKNGAHIVSVNPLPEAGLLNFHNPQTPKGWATGTKLADDFLQVRLSGDQALFAGLSKLVLEADDDSPDGVLDREFIEQYCSDFDEWSQAVRRIEWTDIEQASGLNRSEIGRLAKRYLASERVIVCWAMGLTQHRDAVATIQEITNFLLLRGNIGKHGAGVCPVRGHSNVQGDRTFGIWEKMPDKFLDAIKAEFAFDPPREHGVDTVDAIRAMRDGRTKAFFSMGGNFASATPDTEATAEAMRGLDLVVHVSTKLNKAHTTVGHASLILPCLGRTERDVQSSGEQAVSVEDSFGMVHLSRGRLDPASDQLRSEVAIVTGLAERVFGPDDVVDWAAMRADYDVIRDHAERVVTGCDNFNARVRQPGGFALPHPPRDSRTFPTATGKARFSTNPLDAL